MGLQVALEIMSTDEVFSTPVTYVLTVIQMSLDVGLDVLLATKATMAAGEGADPFVVFGVRTGNVLVDLITGH
jgi:hypothetical protein